MFKKILKQQEMHWTVLLKAAEADSVRLGANKEWGFILPNSYVPPKQPKHFERRH